MEILAAQSSRRGATLRRPGSRVLELDGLRALAILLVLGCHYPGFASMAGGLPEFGWIGVEIFFSLSGYLITTILLGLRDRKGAYTTFYSRRFIRILPPYVCVTVFLIVIAVHENWMFLNLKYLVVSQLLFLQAIPGASLVFLAHLGSAHFVPLLGSSLPVVHPGAPMNSRTAADTYWSLSIEEYFYLLWAPIVLRFSRPMIVAIALAVCIAEMLLRWMVGAMFAYFSLVYRFDALLFGALLAILLEHWREHGKPKWGESTLVATAAISALGLAALLFLISPILGREIRASVLYLVFGLPLFSVAMAALLGIILLHEGAHWTKLLRSPVLVFIGTISYTMYLVHILAAAGVNRFVTRSPLAEALLASLFTIAISYVSWHWLEKPLLRWKDRRFPNTPHPAEPKIQGQTGHVVHRAWQRWPDDCD